jgi:hypothetical protein
MPDEVARIGALSNGSNGQRSLESASLHFVPLCKPEGTRKATEIGLWHPQFHLPFVELLFQAAEFIRGFRGIQRGRSSKHGLCIFKTCCGVMRAVL